MQEKNNTKKKPLTKSQASQLRSIIDDAISRRPTVNLTLHVPATA